MSDLGYSHAGSLIGKVEQELKSPPPGFDLHWWPKFSEAIGGLRGGELTVLCAPTGAGKTQLLANLACQLWMSGIPLFCAPVETGDVDFVIRMLSVMEGEDWNTGKAHSETRVQYLLNKYGEALRTTPLYIANYDNRVAVEDMESILRYQAAQYGVRVALLDNLNFFLKISRAQDQILEIDEAVRVIGNVAKQTKLHIILVCHPRKTDGGRVVSEFDIKGSSSIVQEAWNVLLFNRPPAEADVPLTYREAVYRKMRRKGTVVGKQFWFKYVGGRYEEMPHFVLSSGGRR